MQRLIQNTWIISWYKPVSIEYIGEDIDRKLQDLDIRGVKIDPTEKEKRSKNKLTELYQTNKLLILKNK